MRQDKMHTLACPPKLFNAVLAQLRSLRRGIFASRQSEERRAYFVYVQALKHSISTTPLPQTRAICAKTRRRPYAYFVYVQALQRSIGTAPFPQTRDICVKTRRQPKYILCVCIRSSTQYWHSSVPSDEGYLRQDKAKSDALTLCMCKPLNTALVQHRSL